MANTILSKLQFLIGADNRVFLSKIQQSQTKMVGFQKSVTKFAKLGAAVLATGALSRGIQETVRLAGVQLAAEASLLQALGNREAIQERLLQQAKSIQKVSLFGDEEIIKQQAFLANLGFQETQIKETISAAIELSSALGQTLEFGVRNLAKTLGGLTGELGELIPQLKDFSVSQLKAGAAVEFSIKQFAGQARVAAEVGTGPMVQLSNIIGDIKEEIGTGLLPHFRELAILAKDMDISELAEDVKSLVGGMRDIAQFGEDFNKAMTGEALLITIEQHALALKNKLAPAVEEVIKAASGTSNQFTPGVLGSTTTDTSAAQLKILGDTIKSIRRGVEDIAIEKEVTEELQKQLDIAREIANSLGFVSRSPSRSRELAEQSKAAAEELAAGLFPEMDEQLTGAGDRLAKAMSESLKGKGTPAIKGLNEELENTAFIANTLTSSFQELFSSILQGGADAGDVFKSLVASLAGGLLNSLTGGLFGGLFGGAGGGGGGLLSGLFTSAGPSSIQTSISGGRIQQTISAGDTRKRRALGGI